MSAEMPRRRGKIEGGNRPLEHITPFRATKGFEVVGSGSLFVSEERSGIIGQELITYKGEDYDMRYVIVDPQNRKPFCARISLFDPRKSIETQGVATNRWVEMSLAPYELVGCEYRVEYGGEDIEIHLETTTRPGYEGKGLGTNLLLGSDSVIKDLIDRRPERFLERDIQAIIVDNAHPVQLSEVNTRAGWSSQMAQRLGYQRTKDYKGHPCYRKEFY
jgi:hypothetical protein